MKMSLIKVYMHCDWSKILAWYRLLDWVGFALQRERDCLARVGSDSNLCLFMSEKSTTGVVPGFDWLLSYWWSFQTFAMPAHTHISTSSNKKTNICCVFEQMNTQSLIHEYIATSTCSLAWWLSALDREGVLCVFRWAGPITYRLGNDGVVLGALWQACEAICHLTQHGAIKTLHPRNAHWSV